MKFITQIKARNREIGEWCARHVVRRICYICIPPIDYTGLQNRLQDAEKRREEREFTMQCFCLQEL